MEINYGKISANEERRAAYLNLINALLNCPSGEESQILKANQGLIDAGLVETIAQVADVLVQRGDQNTADFLINLSAQVADALGLSKNLNEMATPQRKESKIATSEVYLDFLLQVLQTTAESGSDTQVVYLLLAANLDKLDDEFAAVLKNWATTAFAEATPEQAELIAGTISSFSNLIQQFPLGNEASNLEIALTGFETALNVFSRDNFPMNWAMNQVQLGRVYLNRIRSERAENLEKSIAACQNALQIYTRETFPENWATIQNNLGNAYSDRIVGYRAENLEQAIACYEQALQIYTCTAFPQQWATIQNNLGNAYSDRIRGDKAENLEQAIACYEQALKIYIREAFPQQWATTQNNLGSVFNSRIRGEKAENFELAIFCYQAALQVRTRENFPQEWAATQNNLAASYSNRIRGDRAENLEQSIACYQAALQVYTNEAFPQDWAMSQNNLGIAYRERIRGDRAENLERAIACYHAALQVRTREVFPQQWAASQNNLGTAYGNRLLGDRAGNLERAIACYQNALQVYTREAFPERWAGTQNNLGNAYRELAQIAQAITCYQNALEIFTPTAFPIDCLRTGRNLGNTAFTAQSWDAAIEGFAVAIEAVEQSHSWATSELRRQEILEEANDIYQKIVQGCVAHQQLDKAIEYVERSKAHNLIDLIATRDRYPKGDIPTQTLNEFKHLQQEIEAEYRKIDIAERKPFKEGNINSLADTMPDRTHLNQLRQKLDDLIIREIQPIDPTFNLTYRVEPISFKQIQALLPDDNTSILEWYITDDIFLTFIITRQTIHPLVWQSSSEDKEALMEWVKEYLQDYSGNKSQWKEKLSKRLQCLAQILHIDQIISYLPLSCNQLILIPHRFLHLLPLHALPLTGGQHCILDSFTVSYAPNCQLLQLSQKRQRLDFTHLFAIQNPTKDLAYSDLEVETIRRDFENSNVLVKEAAQKEAFDNQQLHNVHCLHLACHGYFDFEEPLNSALILAGGTDPTSIEKANAIGEISSEEGSKINLEKSLKLADIFNLDLSQCRLVTLSACETGFTNFTSLSDEYISLSSGFLVAGSPSVVGSLWAVEDLSTAFLMIEFYNNLKRPTSVAYALNQAQRWLRDVTKTEFEKWIAENQLTLSPTLKMNIRRRLHKLQDFAQPFQSPFYWAGFCAIGQS